MKKLIFTLFSFCLLYGQANAQACASGSGPSICDTNSLLSAPGLAPLSDSLAPVYNGSNCQVVIQFENYDTITFSSKLVHVLSLQVANITNLPGIACWATNSPNNTYTTAQKGCIAVSFDTMCATPGQYQLGISVNVVTTELGTINGLSAAAAGLYYYVRVVNPGDTTPTIDTTGQAEGTDTIQTGGYSTTSTCARNVCDSGETAAIREVELNINGLAISPNPFNQTAIVSFTSAKTAAMTEKLTDVLGRTIWSKPITVQIGANQSKIDRSSLPSGIYFYSIGDGHSSTNRKIIITE